MRRDGCLCVSRAGLTHLLRVLPIPRADPDLPVESSAERLLASFGRHLLNERALAESTTTAYLLRARRFLAWTAADGNVTALRTGDVTRAVLRESQSVSIGSAQFFVAAVRSFLRFCFVEGLIPVDLAPAALAVTGRRRSTLPRGISPKDARALLRACDRRQAAGRRDYAVVTTLLRLGLRAQEVANLTLDDIDWRAAEIVVHGKVLIRTDGAGSSHAFLDWLTRQRLSYSVGFALPNNTAELLALMHDDVWTPAYNSNGAVREGAWVAELTGIHNLTG